MRTRQRATTLTIAVTLTLFLFLAPWLLAERLSGNDYPSRAALVTDVTGGFVQLTEIGEDHLPTPLSGAAEFWRSFHLIKAALAG